MPKVKFAVPEQPESDVEMESDVESGEEGDEGDSDLELQVALRDGLLKSDSLNIIGEAKRPPINKKTELEQALKLLEKKTPWIETLDVTVPNQTLTQDVINDDFEREVNFYKQAVEAMKLALPRLKSLNVPIFRPADYFAEMAKSDDHMQKVRKRLMEEKEMRQRQETIRRIREEKKYATSVQREVLATRQTEKRKLADAVKKHRKGMKTQLETMLNNAEQMLKDDEVPEARGPKKHIGAARAQTARKMSRSIRDKKFGFGGQKKRSKRNDKDSFAAFDAGRKGKRGGKKR
ncbi:hypothetical protein QR680_007131 [Steinernema hermaphroditum]|uniref:Uncharacterized protein n=1 Tax=Steinernema hermaphroditum TaxID=289476 RepID=A0AA39HXS2_9BILA|nr:hypothetical protein QR680_007131 [Steinernema hermaphroditum]